MLSVGGRPLLEHLIAWLRRHRITEIAINLHDQPEVILDHFGDGSPFDVSLTYSHEARLLGSAGAARRLAWFFSRPGIVIKGDLLTDIDLSALVNRHLATGAAATLALHRRSTPGRAARIELGDAHRVTASIERPASGTTGDWLVSAGVYVFEPAVLRQIPVGQAADFDRDVVPDLIQQGNLVAGFAMPGYTLTIDSTEHYQQAQQDVRSGRFGLAPCDDVAAAV
jgi:mannose-1-phosphate guanylyltransferase/phosphomannomutase